MKILRTHHVMFTTERKPLQMETTMIRKRGTEINWGLLAIS